MRPPSLWMFFSCLVSSTWLWNILLEFCLLHARIYSKARKQQAHIRHLQTSAASAVIFTRRDKAREYRQLYITPCISEVTEFHNVLLKIEGCETQCTTEHHQTKPQKIAPRRIVTTQPPKQQPSHEPWCCRRPWSAFDITSGNHSAQHKADANNHCEHFVW